MNLLNQFISNHTNTLTMKNFTLIILFLLFYMFSYAQSVVYNKITVTLNRDSDYYRQPKNHESYCEKYMNFYVNKGESFSIEIQAVDEIKQNIQSIIKFKSIVWNRFLCGTKSLF